MPTRKKNPSKTHLTTASGSTSSPSKRRRTSRASSALTELYASATRKGHGRTGAVDVSKYVGPGAAVLATGALAAVGYALRDQLLEVAASAVKSAATTGVKAVARTSKAVDAARDEAMDTVEKLTDSVSLDSILRLAGLQRRDPWMAAVGPMLGVVTGFVAGAAVTHFFGDKLLTQLIDKGRDAIHSTDEMADGVHDELPNNTKGPSLADETRVNGGSHRGIS